MNMIQTINDVLSADVTMSRAAAFAAIAGGAVAWEIVKTVAHCIFYRVRKWRRDRYHRSPAYLAQVAAEEEARKAYFEQCCQKMRENDRRRFEEMAAEIGNL